MRAISDQKQRLGGHTLTAEQLRDLGDKCQRVLRLMWDLQWHTREELAEVAGFEATRRLRELRQAGWPIEGPEPTGQKGVFKYRLTRRSKEQPKEPEQAALFGRTQPRSEDLF